MQLSQLLHLCQFADSALPIGSFAFSNGLESAIQMNLVHDESTLKEFIQIILRQSANLDGIYVLHAFSSVNQSNIQTLVALNQSYLSKRVGKEQQLMSSRIGSKLATLFLEITSSEILTDFMANLAMTHQNQAGLNSQTAILTPAHPIVHGIICYELGISQEQAFAIYQYGTASMILSAAVRLMRIDHYQTQRILFEVSQTTDQDYLSVCEASIDEAMSYAPVYDCLISQHIDTHVRMFMN